MTPTTPADLAELERLAAKMDQIGSISASVPMAVLHYLLAAARQVPALQAEVERWREMHQAHLSAMRMIREWCEARVVSALPSEEALLCLWGPEPRHEAEAIVACLAALPAPAQAEPVARDLAEAAWNAALRTPTAPFELATLLLTRDRLDAIIRTVRAAPSTAAKE